MNSTDALIARQVKSARRYGRGVSFQAAYGEWIRTGKPYYRWLCHWLLMERFCKGLF